MNTLTVQVPSRTGDYPFTWYVTWDNLPDDWAIMVLNERVFVPGHHTTTLVGEKPYSFPSTIERHTEFIFSDDKHGRIEAFSSFDAARKYIYKKAAA